MDDSNQQPTDSDSQDNATLSSPQSQQAAPPDSHLHDQVPSPVVGNQSFPKRLFTLFKLPVPLLVGIAIVVLAGIFTTGHYILAQNTKDNAANNNMHKTIANTTTPASKLNQQTDNGTSDTSSTTQHSTTTQTPAKSSTSPTGTATSPASSQSKTPPSQTSKTIAIDMYIDYQSPYSVSYFSITQQVAAKFGSSVAVSYKDFPLTQIHANAIAAAQAAESAKILGNLSGMQTLLLNNQSSWASSSNPLAIFDTYATQLGFNVSQFNTDYSSTGVQATISSNIQQGNNAGVNSVPTFFFNNTLVSNSNLSTVSAFSNEVNQYVQ